MKSIKSQELHPSDYADIEAQLRELFFQLIFKPVIDLLRPHNEQMKAAARQLRNSSNREMRNAQFDPIVLGIQSGRIQYVDGVFSGNFNAAISAALKKYGAQFNKRTSTWSIVPQALPTEVIDAAKESDKVSRGYHEAVEDRLKNMEFTLSYEIQENPIDASKTISKLDKKFNEDYGDALGTTDLSKEAKKRLNRRYAQSLAPYIKKFSQEQILALRQVVKANAETGYRFDHLVDYVEQRYSVTKSKAEFLARNETSRYVSRAREERFGDVGITSYVWRTSNDADVRDSHKKLRGRTFKYSNPPITDEATGARNNPGEDYSCRCVADPILTEVLAIA